MIDKSEEELSPIKSTHNNVKSDIKFRKFKNCEEIARKSYMIFVLIKKLKLTKPV